MEIHEAYRGIKENFKTQESLLRVAEPIKHTATFACPNLGPWTRIHTFCLIKNLDSRSLIEDFVETFESKACGRNLKIHGQSRLNGLPKQTGLKPLIRVAVLSQLNA